MPDKPLIFISHITEEAELAQLFKREIERSFLNMVEVFVSSDNASISIGTNWLEQITNGLRTCKAIMIFCSPASIVRPWINFEAGAGWARSIEIVPLCHSGIRPVDLPLPLNLMQGVEAHDQTKITEVFRLIAGKLGSGTPTVDAATLAAEVSKFEQTYSIELKAVGGLRGIQNSWPELIADLKRAGSGRMLTAQGIPEWKVNQVRPALTDLENNKLLQFSFNANSMALGGPGSGIFGDLAIQISPDLNTVLQKRF